MCWWKWMLAGAASYVGAALVAVFAYSVYLDRVLETMDTENEELTTA